MIENSQLKHSIDSVAKKLDQATIDRPTDTTRAAARFVLELGPDADSIALARQIDQDFAALGAKTTRLHPTDPSILVLTLTYRMMGGNRAAAFEAAYALADFYALESCEPDIETDFYPEPAPLPKVPGQPESFDNFPPGCWVNADDELNGKWRWPLDAMRVPQAWAFSEAQGRPSRGAGIVIAQPDTGVAPHVELDGVSQAAGYDFINNDSVPTDPLNYTGQVGHGTATASVAISPEVGRVFGSAPRATHMPLRAIETVVRVSQVRVAQAMDFAVDHGAHVITMSLGGVPSFALNKALRRAVKADVIVLAAAGNCVGLVVWPARYDICVAVAGTNFKDGVWKGTCKGSDVDISAPAENVYRAKVVEGQTGKGADVVQGQGTSFAVALTAGVAAMWLAHHGRANLIAAARARGETLQDMFVRLLRATARRPEKWDSAQLGAGIVDANSLLRADLDLGRDRESTQPVAEQQSEMLSVRRLVTEAVSAEAATAAVDWKRYGQEVAAAILDLRKHEPTGDDTKLRPETALGAAPQLSPSLKGASHKTELGKSLGIKAPAA